MKILAIRGRNLASLYGDFDVDLASGSLGRAGVFAITGPTGSGKSTLLDAMCLALFRDTPRLEGRGGPEVGRAGTPDGHRLGARDARGLLSRGAAEGLAEVDFVGADGGRYRASWRVQRARRKPDGKLQSPVSRLEDLDGATVLVDDKRVNEFDGLIQQKVGLSFAQFQRTVLLAQGSFAAFLKGKEAERAEILEAMTESDHFRQLSKGAFLAAKQEAGALERLDARLEAIGSLPAEERAALEEELTQRIEERAAAQRQRDETTAGLSWYGAAEALRLSLDEALALVAGAEQRWRDGAALRAELEQVRAAEPLRAPVVAMDRALVQLEAKGAARVGRRAVAEEARAARVAAATALDACRQRQGDARGALDQAIPELERAVALDQQIAAEHSRQQGEQRKLLEVQREEREVSERLVAAQAQRAALQSARDAASTWISAHPALEALAPRWSAVQQDLDEQEALDEAVIADRGEVEQLRQGAARLAAAADRAETQWQQARGRLAAIEQELSGAQAEAESRDLEALHRSRAAHDEARRRLAAQDAAAHALVAVQDRAAELALALAGHRDIHQRAAEERTAVEVALKVAEARRDEADRARLALSQDQLRAQLVEGEPCPVCGATQHPWVASRPDWGGLAARGDSLRGEVERLHRRLGELDQQLAREAASSADREAALSRAAADEVGLLAAWEEARGALPQRASEAILQITAHRAAVEAALSAVVAEESEALKLRAALDGARRRAQVLAEAERTAGALARDAEREKHGAGELARARQQQLQERETAALRLRERVRQALIAVGLEGSRWALGPAALRGALAAELGRRAEQLEVLGGSEERLRALRVQEATLAERLAQVARTRAERTEGVERLAEALSALRLQRRALLGGATVGAARARLEGALRLAEEQVGDAAAEAERAGQAAAAAASGEAAAVAALEEASREEAEARAALAAALRRAGMDEQALRALLQREPAWIARSEEEISTSATARTKAGERAAERQERLDAHLRQGAPEVEREVLVQRASDLALRLEQVEGRATLVRARLLEDERRRAERSALDAERAAQEVLARRWVRLSAAIGSADGKKFSTFAQGLTLEVLLTYANAHLNQLRPRYFLERIPGENLELQIVDRFQGDEARPVDSLSGGESFLVALSLALGMSSMSASRLRVDSLFIDEGFGTLDQDALGQALGFLQALQSQGRQVGVISHIEAMSEQVSNRVEVQVVGGGRSRVVVR
ncbi:MAG: AAA family ATPase [Deltaproteobacteria bacterium]|nr:AAA family ATPase [Deltaproteobacteria bacterium]